MKMKFFGFVLCALVLLGGFVSAADEGSRQQPGSQGAYVGGSDEKNFGAYSSLIVITGDAVWQQKNLKEFWEKHSKEYAERQNKVQRNLNPVLAIGEQVEAKGDKLIIVNQGIDSNGDLNILVKVTKDKLNSLNLNKKKAVPLHIGNLQLFLQDDNKLKVMGMKLEIPKTAEQQVSEGKKEAAKEATGEEKKANEEKKTAVVETQSVSAKVTP